MKTNYFYSIVDINCHVIPFALNDEKLLQQLNESINGFFSIEKGNKDEIKKIFILSGSNENVLLENSDFVDVRLLEYINTIWHNLYFNYRKALKEWQDLLENNLALLDNNAGLYRLKNIRDCYVILTNPTSSFEQAYKIHCSLEYLVTYLASYQNSVFFHSSCAGFDKNNCFLFIGKSGYGKSTVAGLFNKHNGYVVDDEKNLLKKYNNHYYIYSGQIPAINKEKKYTYMKYGICKKIFLLKKSDTVMIKEVERGSAISYKLIREANKEIGGYPINFPILNKKIIDSFIGELIKEIPVYEFYFKKDSDVKEIFSNFDHYLLKGD